MKADQHPEGFNYDLVIVGGGIVGTTLACALRDSGLQIGIIEAQPLDVVRNRDRAYAVSLLSGEIFQALGIWEQVYPLISKFCNIRLSDSDYGAIVNFQAPDLGRGALGYVGKHHVLLTALQDKIAASSNITWLCPAEVKEVTYQPSGVEISLEMAGEVDKITTPLIVGADGARSRLRNWAGIKTRGWKYWQSCVTFVIKHQHPNNDTAFERFWSSGPMGVLPLADNRCQIVWTAPHAEAKALQDLEAEAFITKLESRMGGLLGNLQLDSPRLLFPVQLMQSNRYVNPRLALIGDAAHCCHPVGGQGLNLGIRDAAALAEVLQTASSQGEDIGKLAVLQRYEGWRKRENLTILGFTDILDRTFSNNWLPIVFIRRLGLQILQTVPPIKLFALQLMTGLKGRYPQLSRR